MQQTFYLDKLYPLQDRVLALLNDSPIDFYLTGGTVVSRHLLHHRYSDDLDFFLNRSELFGAQAKTVMELMKLHYPDTREAMDTEDFKRLFVWDGDNVLKVEMINDVCYRVGFPEATALYARTDIWQNILSNKITALSRNEGKDVADIIFLARRFPFNWREMIDHAHLKDMWVSELDVSERLDKFPIAKMEAVRWIDPPNYESLAKDLKRIALDVFEGGANSLFKG